MPGEMTADDVRELLGLQTHATCGFVAETYRSEERIAPGGLEAPFDAGRPLGSALYFLVTPDAPVRLHRIRNHHLYHRYLGDPIEIMLLHPGGTTGHDIVGPDLRHGHKLQLLIPGNTFHTARLMPGGSWFLGASTEWPGVEAPDVELGDIVQLSELYPAAAQALRSFVG